MTEGLTTLSSQVTEKLEMFLMNWVTELRRFPGKVLKASPEVFRCYGEIEIKRGELKGRTDF